jgi:hypothetical protein
MHILHQQVEQREFLLHNMVFKLSTNDSVMPYWEHVVYVPVGFIFKTPARNHGKPLPAEIPVIDTNRRCFVSVF